MTHNQGRIYSVGWISCEKILTAEVKSWLHFIMMELILLLRKAKARWGLAPEITQCVVSALEELCTALTHVTSITLTKLDSE